MRKAGLTDPLQLARDGQQGLQYLSGKRNFRDRKKFPLPCLVFLDLKLPYVHGFDVLAWARKQPEFAKLPIVILTGSPEERDRKRCKELGANDYLVKPPSGEILQRVVKSLLKSTKEK